MTDQNNNSPPDDATSRRRSSFAGQAFADLFGGGRNRASSSASTNSPPGQYSGPIVSAAVQANQRRMSLTTSLGLGTSPPQGSSGLGGRSRGDSVSSSNNASIDESAVEDDPVSAGANQPIATFGRRVSFGARALRDLNKPVGNGNGSGGANGNNGRLKTETIPEEYILAGGGGDGGRGGKNGHSSPIDVAGSAKHTVSTTAKGRGLSSSSTNSLSFFVLSFSRGGGFGHALPFVSFY